MKKLLFKPLSLGVSVAGGMLAGLAFKQLWKVIAGEDDMPSPTESEYSWGEVLTAAALHGAVFGVVKAAVDRGAAQGMRKLTGYWPGD